MRRVRRVLAKNQTDGLRCVYANGTQKQDLQGMSPDLWRAQMLPSHRKSSVLPGLLFGRTFCLAVATGWRGRHEWVTPYSSLQGTPSVRTLRCVAELAQRGSICQVLSPWPGCGKPANEAERLAATEKLQLIGKEPHPALQRYVDLISTCYQVRHQDLPSNLLPRSSAHS